MEFPFVGNAPWIDFVNTRPAAADGGREDLLPTADALLAWATRAGLLAPDERQGADASWHERSLALRACLQATADALLWGGEIPDQVIAAVNRALAAGAWTPTLVREASGWELRQMPVRRGADLMLARIAADFADTLATGRHALLRRCERSGCVMLFLDTSKNRTRRWCSMELCGNREKAAARRARERRRSPP